MSAVNKNKKKQDQKFKKHANIKMQKDSDLINFIHQFHLFIKTNMNFSMLNIKNSQGEIKLLLNKFRNL